MTTNPLYDAWEAWLTQHWPQERITRLRAAAALIMGVFQGRSVHLGRIAAEVPGEAKAPSQERRLARFLDNAAICPKRWYGTIAGWWLAWWGRTHGEVVLIVDGTRISRHHQLLMVALALPGRALPLAWTWMNCARGHSSRQKQLALLARVHALIPAHIPVVLVGDSEFGAVAVMRHVHEVWHWHYVLRQKSNNQVCTRPDAPDAVWQNFDELVIHAGAMRFVPQGLLTQEHAFPTALLAFWAQGEKDCWLLASSLPSAAETLRYYRQRMLIEEMFGDLKDNGFDLEATRLRRIQRLNRLVLLVCLLYVWLIRTGLMLILSGKRDLIDRHDRRDLSLFQLGFRYVKRLLNNHNPLEVRLCPDDLYDILPGYQIKLSGS